LNFKKEFQKQWITWYKPGGYEAILSFKSLKNFRGLSLALFLSCGYIPDGFNLSMNVVSEDWKLPTGID
jgi:hypothetical protein